MRSVYALALIVVILFHESYVEGLTLRGGLSSVRDATPDVQAVADAIKTELESKTETVFDEYVAEQYATQVVAGLNYFIKVRVGYTNYPHVRVYKDLRGNFNLIGYKLSYTCRPPDLFLEYLYGAILLHDVARNQSSNSIIIISGVVVKDNVAKHQKTDMHGKAVNMELQPTRTIKSILTSTPLGKAFASVTTEEWNRIVKLFDATYILAKEEMPFTKYPAIVELEKRHGVSLGSTYGTAQVPGVHQHHWRLLAGRYA
ncbi:hypothetical protein EMCRGX_G034478 [Ephydatia muelleri]